jgi:hypothetical protein
VLSKRNRAVTRGLLLVAAIALVVGGISLPSGFVLGGDSAWPELAPHVALSQHASAWSDYAGFGEDGALKRPMLPIAAVDAVLEFVGIAPLIVNHLWLLLLLVLQAVAAVRLFLELFPKGRRQTAAIVFVGCAAILNPYILLVFHTPYPAVDLGIVAAPGVLASMLAFLRSGRTRSLFEFFAWAALATCANVNPAYEMEYLALMLCVAGFALAGTSERILRMRRLGEIALVYVGVNIVYWLPILHYVRVAFEQLAGAGHAYTADTLSGTSAFSQPWNVIRLVGGYLFFNPVGGKLYVPEGPSYVSNVVVILASLALPALAWTCWWLSRRDRARSIVFGITAIALVTLFLSKGAAAPLGGVFSWLVEHVPAFEAFRDAFGKFGWILLLCYVLLAGQSLLILEKSLERKRAVATVACAFALLAVCAYPILSGRLFWEQAKVVPPPRYAALASWMQAQPPGTRFMELPVASALFEAFNWGYVGGEFESNLTDRPILSRAYDFAQPGTLAFDDTLQHMYSTIGLSRMPALLGLYGVTDVVTDASMNPNYYAPSSDAAPSEIPSARRAFALGSLAAFRLDDQIVNPRAYAASRVVLGAESVRDIAAACSVMQCRGAAFLDRLPDALSVVRPDRLRFARNSGQVLSPVAGESDFELQVRSLQPADVRAGAASLGQGNVLDYANLTLGSRSDLAGQTPLAVAGIDPVAVNIASRNGAPFSQVFDLRQSSPNGRDVCSAPKSMASLVIPVPDLPGDAVLAIAVRYRLAGNAWINVVGASPFGNFLVRLSAGGNSAAVRLFKVPASEELSITGVVQGGDRSTCLHIADIAIGRARLPDAWTLMGSASDFFVTSPYVARYASLSASAASLPYRRITRGSTSSPAASSLLLPAPWNPPITIAGAAQGVRATGGAGATPDLSVYAQNAQAAVYALVERVLPDASYQVRVPLRSWSGTAPRILVLAQDGEVLGQHFATRADAASDVVMTVDNPRTSGRLQVYVYVGSDVVASSSAVLGEASAMPTNAAGTFGLQPGGEFAVPQSLDVTEASPSEYDVSVIGAPRRYLLVLNTSLNPGWSVTAPAGVHATHIAANIYMNGWIVTGPGSYHLVISYDGERSVKEGVGIALLCLLSVVAMRFPRKRARR